MIRAIYKRNPVKLRRPNGFTLIELTLSMVVMAIALTFISVLFFSAPQKSVEPLLQIRAAEFGRALMMEILSKSFDEQSPLGGVPACVDSGVPCTAASALGGDGEARQDFNDVDDYDVYCDEVNPVALVNSMGVVPNNFNNYLMSVCVFYDADYDGVDDGVRGDAKLIRIVIFVVTAGQREAITFHAYRSNF